MTELHPELTRIRFLPKFSTGPRLTKLMRGVKVTPKDPGDDMTVRTISVPGVPGAPDVALRVFQPKTLAADSPAMFWIHGGGMVGGSPEQDDRTNIAFAKALGITVAAVKYRLAPEHPAPAAIDDVYAGLLGFYSLAGDLGFDATRVAIGGGSAGGGLAAALAQVAHDRGEVKPVFQLLVYPMLDDRTTNRPASDFRNARVWLPKSNLFGWKSYVGEGVGGPGISSDYAPGRRENLSGLPPAWIGVGTLDLFHDEDLDYAVRLKAAGVAVETYEVQGAFHGFDALFPKTVVVRDWWQHQADALTEALGVSAPASES